jgi:hypothetical protein
VVHAITGRPPFEGSRVWEILDEKLGRGLALDPSISPESAGLLAAMTATDPNQRPMTYDDLIARIDQLPALREEYRTPRGALATVSRRYRNWFHSKWRILAAASTAAAVLIAALVLGNDLWASRHSRDENERPTRYVSTSDHRSLFDGLSLREWLPPATGGTWELGTDEESEPILTGMGYTRRTFAPLENYRLTLGVDVHEAAMTEIHFAIPSAAPNAGERLVIQVSRSGGAVLGIRDGDRGEFQPQGDAIPFPSPAWLKDRKPYLEVRIERTGPKWTAWFNGQRVGSHQDDRQPKASELRINATGGTARVNSVFLTALKVQ